MSRLLKILLGANAALLFWNLYTTASSVSGLTYAQRSPEISAEGIPYFKVNINPTDTPPMVDINPHQTVPLVEVTRMPEIRLRAAGCENRQNFRTGIGRSISGPLVVTYLNLPQQSIVTLADLNGSERLTLEPAGQLTTAIFLASGQRLEFGSDIMYSGCQPE